MKKKKVLVLDLLHGSPGVHTVLGSWWLRNYASFSKCIYRSFSVFVVLLKWALCLNVGVLPVNLSKWLILCTHMQRCFVTNHYLKSQSFINCFGSELISQISTGYFFFCRFRFLVTSETIGTHLFHVYLGVSVNARVSSWNLNHCFLYPYFTSPAVHPSHLFVLRDKNR